MGRTTLFAAGKPQKIISLAYYSTSSNKEMWPEPELVT
jgi:hypothetical protein